LRREEMPDIAYVNGEFLPIEEAKVSVEDRGLQFGDSIYEVIRGVKGKLFRSREHIERLRRSAEAIRMHLPFVHSFLENLVKEAYRRGEYEDAILYLQITRGAAPREHTFPERVTPSLIVTVRMTREIPENLRRVGVPAITTPDIRWGRCDIKSTNLLANVLAKEEARSKGAFEAIFVRDGIVTEGTATTVFVVRDGVLMTHPKGPRILPGITREETLKIAEKEGIEIREEAFTRKDLLNGDEVFLASTTVSILPVVSIDGREIGSGKPGAISLKLYELLLREMKG